MTSDDILFVWWMGHGTQDGSCPDIYFSGSTYDEKIYDHELASYVDQITNYKKRIFLFAPCNSGGIIDDLENDKTIISTSVACGVLSYSGNYDVVHTEFTYLSYCALNWETPGGSSVDADNSNNGLVSIYEKWNYVDDNNVINGSPQYDDNGSIGSSSYIFTAGNLKTNTTLSSDIEFEGDITCENGHTLSISSDVLVTFENGSSLIVEGTFDVNGTYSDKAIIDFESQNSSLQNGIKVISSTSDAIFGGTASIEHAVIKNAHCGIEIDESDASATIDNCTIEYSTIGVKFMNGATGTVSNTTSKNNIYGIYSFYSNPIIQNCTITNNTYGLRLFYSYPTPSWSTVHISNNSISSNSAYGLYVYNSSPTLSNNTISNNGRGTVLYYSSDPIIESTSFVYSTYYGLACYGSASPNLNYNSTYGFGGYNVITGNNNIGITITGTSFPDLGLSVGYNSILNNTGYEVSNSTSNYIQARYNWWGSATGLGTSTVYGLVRYVPYLTSDPIAQQQSSAMSTIFVYDNTSEVPEDLQMAIYEQGTSEYKSSAERFKTHFSNNNNSKFSEFAAVQYIKSLKGYLDEKSVIDEITRERSKKQTAVVECELLSGEASLLSLQKQPLKAISRLDKALEFKLKEETKYRLIAQKAMILIYDIDSEEQGKAILEEIVKNDSKESPWYELATHELELFDEKPFLKKGSVNDDIQETPKEYQLFVNYPNPFNPTTQISYELPKDGFVNLVVYNTLGQVVKELVSQRQTSGRYSVQFNASNLPSGVYIYKLQVGEFYAAKKMILLR